MQLLFAIILSAWAAYFQFRKWALILINAIFKSKYVLQLFLKLFPSKGRVSELIIFTLENDTRNNFLEYHYRTIRFAYPTIKIRKQGKIYQIFCLVSHENLYVLISKSEKKGLLSYIQYC